MIPLAARHQCCIQNILPTDQGYDSNISLNWKKLQIFIKPSASIRNSVERRRARLVSALTIPFAITAAIATQIGPQEIRGTLGIMFITLLFAYLLSRTRYIELAAIIVVTSAHLPTYAALLTIDPEQYQMFFYTAWLLIPFLLAAVWLSVGYILFIYLGNILTLTGLAFYMPGWEVEYIQNALLFLFLTGALSLLFAWFNRRDLSELELTSTTLMNINTQLNEAIHTAVNASKAKSEFLSNMSHELRTPLNAIIGFSDLLLADSQQPLSSEQTESLNEIYRGGQHLRALIDDVLDISRIEQNRITLNIEQVDLCTTISNCISAQNPMARTAHISLHFDNTHCTNISVLADHTRLTQVLINLLSNAIKYNHEDGKVYITVDSNTNSNLVAIHIRDTGIGIDNAKQEQLFKPFNRLGAELSGIEGMGLGLALSKRLVEEMDGRIDVDSSLGEGSTFHLYLLKSELYPHS